MRIAVITSGFARDENETGGAAALHNFVKMLSLSPDIEITVFTMYWPHDRKEYDYFGAKVYSFAEKQKNNKWDKLRIWRNLNSKFGEIHKTKPFELIQALWLGEPGYTAAGLSKKHNIPLVAAVCGGELAAIESINYGSRLSFRQNYFVTKALEQSKIVIAGSDFIVNKLKQVYNGKFYYKAKKIPFGVDENVFSPGRGNEARTGLNLINIANCVPVKAHEDLFKAVKLVKEKFPAVTLTCCGRDDDNLMPGLVKKYGLEENVKLMGIIDHTDIPFILSNSDIFVLSSLYESENVSMIEAAFCGLPVVSTKVGVADEITPYISEPGDFKQLAEKIISVITDYENIRKISEEKVTDFLKIFSLAESTSRFLELYKKILKH